MLRYVFRKTGPLTSNIAEAGAFVKSRPELAECDVQLHFAPVFFVDHGFKNPPGHGFSLGALLLTPKSAGRIYLRSADPREAPAMDPAYLSNEEDLAPLEEGLKLVWRLLESKAFDAYRGEPVFERRRPRVLHPGARGDAVSPGGDVQDGARCVKRRGRDAYRCTELKGSEWWTRR